MQMLIRTGRKEKYMLITNIHFASSWCGLRIHNSDWCVKVQICIPSAFCSAIGPCMCNEGKKRMACSPAARHCRLNYLCNRTAGLPHLHRGPGERENEIWTDRCVACWCDSMAWEVDLFLLYFLVYRWIWELVCEGESLRCPGVLEVLKCAVTGN